MIEWHRWQDKEVNRKPVTVVVSDVNALMDCIDALINLDMTSNRVIEDTTGQDQEFKIYNRMIDAKHQNFVVISKATLVQAEENVL